MSKKIKPVDDTAETVERQAGAPAVVKQPVVGKAYTQEQSEKLERYAQMEEINAALSQQVEQLQAVCARYIDEIDRLTKRVEELESSKTARTPLAASPSQPERKPEQKLEEKPDQKSEQKPESHRRQLPLQRTYANVYRNNSTLDGYSCWN